jgi:hypothetical protein
MGWRVAWGDWSDPEQHDWIGRRRLQPPARRAPPPHTQSRYFETRELAEGFAANMRRRASDPSELLIEIIEERRPRARPQQLSMAADWPLQRE